jgi:hypothetical protein
MLNRFIADTVVCLHFLFILFAVFGGLLILWKKWLVLLHLPAVVWSALIEFNNWICPLTPLENRFRLAGREQGYTGGFIEHYLIPVIYPAGLTREIQILLGSAAIVVNITVYVLVIRILTKNARP